MSRLRSVQFLHVNVRTVYAPNVMVRTWQQVRQFRLVRRSESWPLSQSENQVHSLLCVHSIMVELPVTISHRVFLVSRSFSRQEDLRDLPSSQRSQDVQHSVIQRRNVRLSLQTKRQENPNPILFLTDHVSKYRTALCLKPEMSLQKVA